MKNLKRYIYGAGLLGGKLSDWLSAAGIKIDAFVDPKKVGVSHKGLPVEGWNVVDENSILYIGVLNNWVSLKNVCNEAKKYGAKEVLTPPEIFFLLGDNGQSRSWYWLNSDKNAVLEACNRTSNFYKNRLDCESLRTLQSIIKYRLNGLIDETCVLPESRQYLDAGIKDFWKGEIHLLDAGAYTGDTVAALMEEGLNLKTCYSFEPDPLNFAKLIETFKILNISGACFQAALGESNGNVKFNSSGTSGSSINTNIGNDFCLQVTGDSSLNLFVSHIKMDVEGAELGAMRGLSTLIKKHSPKLAISAYHKPFDLIDIAEYIDSFGIYKQFAIRTYANQTFETIIYASP